MKRAQTARIMLPGGKHMQVRIEPDVDLEKEVVLLPSGERLTEAVVERIVDEARAAMAGRPSLTAPGTRSPEVKARVPRQTKERLDAVAAKRGTTASEIIREALDAYLKTA